MKYQEWKIPYGKLEIPVPLLEEGFSPLLAALLNVRGMSDPEEARKFLFGGAELLENPLLLTDVPLAVGRIVRAIQNEERVAVYGDYDVDGITAACLMTDYLRSRGLDCELYIPDRIEEGYGLNKAAIEHLSNKGITLIITVDCGVTATEEVDYASSIGVDMIITDHHECQDALPNAVAVIDPKRPDCNYPSRNLAGVGVAFKLVCAIDGDAEKMLGLYADLIAVGTVADVMPLNGENRHIVKAGFKKLEANPRPGLAALLTEAGSLGKKMTTLTIGYGLAPRLNAAGRLGQAFVSAELLLAKTETEGRILACQLCKLNRDRQSLEMEIWEQTMSMLGIHDPEVPIVLADETWHQGVIGIAASRLTEAFNVPAVIICLDGDIGKGSCRSYGNFNLFDALGACSEHLESFGGHAMAAGLSIRREKIEDFRRAFEEYYIQNPPAQSACLETELHMRQAEMLSMESVESLSMLEPCGCGNPKPKLCITGALLESLSPISGGRHLRIRVSKFRQSFDCVFFSHSEKDLGLKIGNYVDIVFSPQINEFRSRRSVQLVLMDIRRSDTTSLCMRLLTGGEILPGEAADILPVRAEFTPIWRRLHSLGGRVFGRLSDVRRSLDMQMHPGTLCTCLKVFSELNLIDMSFDGEVFDIVQKSDIEKVDLYSSSLLQKLISLN